MGMNTLMIGAGCFAAGLVIGCGYTCSYLRKMYIIPLEGANECMKKALGWSEVDLTRKVRMIAKRGMMRDVRVVTHRNEPWKSEQQ